MSRTLSRRLSRRQLLATAAALGGSLALPETLSAAPPAHGLAKKVLEHDEVQGPPAFARGKAFGASVGNRGLGGPGAFESEVIEAPFPFTHVGLHWRGTRAAASFEVRTSADGVNWSSWQALQIEANPGETPTGDTFASLVGAPGHLYLQYRGDIHPNGAVDRVTATFLNSKDGPSIQSAALEALANPSCIDFNRGQWQCDESLRLRRKKEIWPRMYVPVKKLVVHHTVSSNDYTDGAAEVRAIYTYHARTLGWGDIGYNVLIDRSGFSYEGRYGRELAGGREVFSPDVVAGHASAHNYGSSGAALIGSFHIDSGEALLADGVMIERLLDVLEQVARLRGIDPAGASDFLLSNGGWNSGLENVSGHRDCVASECPGELLYSRLGEIRASLADRIELGAAPAVLGPDGPPSQKTGDLAYTWSGPAGTEYAYYLEGWSKSSSSEDIGYLSGYTTDKHPQWSGWTTETSRSFSPLTDGHYTFHLRARSAGGETYEANRTRLISGASSGGGPGKGGGRPF